MLWRTSEILGPYSELKVKLLEDVRASLEPSLLPRLCDHMYCDPSVIPLEKRRLSMTCKPLKLSLPPLVLVSISANLLVTVVPLTTLNSRIAEPTPVVGSITTPVILLVIPRRKKFRPWLPT